MFYAIKRKSTGEYFYGKFGMRIRWVKWSRDIKVARLWRYLSTAKSSLTRIRKDSNICTTNAQKEDLVISEFDLNEVKEIVYAK